MQTGSDDPRTPRTPSDAAVFDAAEEFDRVPFWDRFGREAVDRLRLPPGARVLDVCCGTGASALHAAQVVGPLGSVLGVDLSPRQVDRARRRAADRGLTNTRFEVRDVDDLDVPGDQDAVVCVFGVFFAVDMVASTRRMLGALRPGGVLALTVWGPDPMGPAMGEMLRRVKRLRPGWEPQPPAWEPLASEDGLRGLLESAGGADCVAELVAGTHPVAPDDWWTIVLGSGLRGLVMDMEDRDRVALRDGMEDWLRDTGVTALRADVVHGTAHRPG